MGSILADINFNPIAFGLNIIGFLILMFLLNKFLFAPVGALLDRRQQDIAGTYEQLESDQRQMKALKDEYEQRLAEVEAEGRERINNMIKEAQASRDQLLQDAQARAKEMVTRAEAEIAREQEQAMITIRQQVVELALGAAHRIIGDGLDEARQRKLINEFIEAGGVTVEDVATAAPAKKTLVGKAALAATPSPVLEATPVAELVPAPMVEVVEAPATETTPELATAVKKATRSRKATATVSEVTEGAK